LPSDHLFRKPFIFQGQREPTDDLSFVVHFSFLSIYLIIISDSDSASVPLGADWERGRGEGGKGGKVRKEQR